MAFDDFLGELLALVDERTVLIVVSDHGHAPTLLHQNYFTQHRHGPPGILLACGGPLRAGARLDQAAVLDIFPTVLYLLGLPIPKDAAGFFLADMVDPQYLSAHPVAHRRHLPRPVARPPSARARRAASRARKFVSCADSGICDVRAGAFSQHRDPGVQRVRAPAADAASRADVRRGPDLSGGDSGGGQRQHRRHRRDRPTARASTGHPVRVLHEAVRGKGAAVRTGALAALGAWVFLADADLSMPIEEVERFLPARTGDADIAIASREAPGAVRYDEPELRHLMGRVFNLWVRLLAVPGIADTQCGFKCFRGAVARDLFARQTVRDWTFDVEILFLARRAGYRLVEVPIHWTYKANSRVNPLRDALRMAAGVLRVRWNAIAGVYGRRAGAQGV